MLSLFLIPFHCVSLLSIAFHFCFLSFNFCSLVSVAVPFFSLFHCISLLIVAIVFNCFSLLFIAFIASHSFTLRFIAFIIFRCVSSFSIIFPCFPWFVHCFSSLSIIVFIVFMGSYSDWGVSNRFFFLDRYYA